MEPGNSQTKDFVSEVDHSNHNATTKDEGQQRSLLDVDSSNDDTRDMECGIGSFRPSCLQPYTNIYCFVLMYSFAALSTSTLSSYITSQITALERQFGFSSAESGFLLACNDIGFLVTVLFVSYYLRNSHAPRFLSFLTFLFGISGLICALPYFLGSESIQSQRKMPKELLDNNDLTTNSSVSDYNMDYEYMCWIQTGTKEDTIGDKDAVKNNPEYHIRHWTNTLALVILAIGMVIQGAAKSGRSPLITSYIDNNVKKTKTGKFVGIITSVAIMAPSVSFSSATIFSRLYFTLEKTDLTPEDPRWIGAWWLGFLVFGIAAIIFTFPIMLFPRRLPKKKCEKEDINLERKLKIKSSANENKSFSALKDSLKGFFKSIIRIIRQPPYILLASAMSVKMLGIAGVFAFNAKYLEVQFFLPAWKSNAVMGIIKLLALSGGTLIGGLFTSKFKLSARGSLAMITIVHLITGTIDCFYLLAGCELPPIVGPTSIPFRNPAPEEYMMPQCVSTCSCNEHKFLPVCFNNTMTYFSPCFAGCQGKNGSTYTECTCLPDGSTTVTIGFCDSGCKSLYYYIAIAIANAFIGTMLIVPSYIANLRIAGDEDKSLAVGMSTFFTSLVGWMSGPVIFGFLVDAACIVWNIRANERGSCSLYDNTNLKNYMFISRAVLTFTSCLLTALALLAQIRKEKRQQNNKEQKIAEKEFEIENKC